MEIAGESHAGLDGQERNTREIQDRYKIEEKYKRDIQGKKRNMENACESHAVLYTH